MQTNLHTPRQSAPLLAVTAPEDIEFLVKESEVLTGQPGRIFVIAGAERLSYRVSVINQFDGPPIKLGDGR